MPFSLEALSPEFQNVKGPLDKALLELGVINKPLRIDNDFEMIVTLCRNLKAEPKVSDKMRTALNEINDFMTLNDHAVAWSKIKERGFPIVEFVQQNDLLGTKYMFDMLVPEEERDNACNRILSTVYNPIKAYLHRDDPVKLDAYGFIINSFENRDSRNQALSGMIDSAYLNRFSGELLEGVLEAAKLVEPHEEKDVDFFNSIFNRIINHTNNQISRNNIISVMHCLDRFNPEGMVTKSHCDQVISSIVKKIIIHDADREFTSEIDAYTIDSPTKKEIKEKVSAIRELKDSMMKRFSADGLYQEEQSEKSNEILEILMSGNNLEKSRDNFRKKHSKSIIEVLRDREIGAENMDSYLGATFCDLDKPSLRKLSDSMNENVYFNSSLSAEKPSGSALKTSKRKLSEVSQDLENGEYKGGGMSY